MEEKEVIENKVEPDKGKRGGKRPGAGRKAIYADSDEFRRLKCKRNVFGVARTCISILHDSPEKELNQMYSLNIDGSFGEWKGGKRRYWKDTNCIVSSWNIRINRAVNDRIFVLAYLLSYHHHVCIDGFRGDEVLLRWQRVEEVARIMMHSGDLMARRNRLKKEEQEMLDEIPYDWAKMREYLEEN